MVGLQLQGTSKAILSLNYYGSLKISGVYVVRSVFATCIYPGVEASTYDTAGLDPANFAVQ